MTATSAARFRAHRRDRGRGPLGRSERPGRPVDGSSVASRSSRATCTASTRSPAEQAEADADAVDAMVRSGIDPGPLAGVPVALKDNLCTEGVATTCSSRILEGWLPAL